VVPLLALACDDPAPADTDSVPRGALSFAFPLQERDLFLETVGYDHDPEVHEGAEALICTAYDGRPFPACYDEHRGSDYLLEGGFDTMDAGSATILAAADGTVVDTDDGHYDRCHGDLGSAEVSCDGHDQAPNYVTLEHAGGWRTRYLHMLSGSVAVAVGDTVACGDVLGHVGSSGNSSQPHLHFQVEDAAGAAFDPYAGAHSQPETWWLEQGGPEGLPGSACP
jgi:hypothetical protein